MAINWPGMPRLHLELAYAKTYRGPKEVFKQGKIFRFQGRYCEMEAYILDENWVLLTADDVLVVAVEKFMSLYNARKVDTI